jgi:transcriptional regulator with XRE-family HTH domain
MEKHKLIQLRQSKGISQEQMPDKLAITPSTYSRKEKGLVRIRPEEWEKIAKFLNLPVEEVYESDETNYFVIKDQATANYLGTNHVYSIPEYFLETQRKYIERLEKEIADLKASKEN